MSTVKQIVKGEKTSVDFEVCLNKKTQISTVEVMFPKCKDSRHLQMLLMSFKNSKTLACAMPQKVFVFQAVTGNNSIMFSVLDRKILNAILVLYMHLHKMSLSPQQKKFIDTEKDDQHSLYKNLDHMCVKIVGKCPATFSDVESKTKKILAFSDSLDKIRTKFEGKQKDLPKNVKVTPYPDHTFTLAPNSQANIKTLMYYLAIALGGVSCLMSEAQNGVNIQFLDGQHDHILDTLKADVKNCVKTWLEQFGTFSDPKDDDKKKEKIRTQLTSLNAANNIICSVKGIPKVVFNNFNEVGVDMTVISAIKALKEL